MNNIKTLIISIVILAAISACNQANKPIDRGCEKMGDTKRAQGDPAFNKIYQSLKTAQFPQDRNSYDMKDAVRAYPYDFDNFGEICSGFAEEVFFLWKHEAADFNLVMLCATEVATKGTNENFYLICLDKSNKKIDELQAFYLRWVSVPGPEEGSEAAGTEEKTGYIDSDLTIHTLENDVKASYKVTAKGFELIK